ncbi:103_t:CDS:2 [Ambispora gerdemannii]|uniref:ribose-phosphate diphosphokinase n=1 Tax=Ambispora gerdemannii TaxID=144530 RepID=A0A9N8YX10_9GLOM|nr:103_t:CDS:2 [Ambispora gerdemannii]
MRRAKVFSGSSHEELAISICEKLGIGSPAPVSLKKFSNQETSVEIGCSVRNEDVFIIQSGSTHINDHLMELLIMISACKGASASRLTVAGVDHIITMDLHASQIQGFFNKPVDNLYAEPTIAKWIQDTVPGYSKGVVVSKNPGGAKRVTSLADRLKLDFALIHTDRTRMHHQQPIKPSVIEEHHSEDNNSNNSNTNEFPDTYNVVSAIINSRAIDDEDEEDDELHSLTISTSTSVTGEAISLDDMESSTITLVGDVAGRVAFIVDDMIDRAASFISAADHIFHRCNAKKVYVIATHGILSGDSIKEIENCQSIHQLVVTNSFPISLEKRRQSSKLVIIDVSGTLAEAIRRTHNGESISYLFDTPV